MLYGDCYLSLTIFVDAIFIYVLLRKIAFHDFYS